jgi:hypothetical protein
MSNDCETEVEKIVQELRSKSEDHRDKASSVFRSTSEHIAEAQAFEDVADMLEERVL